MWPRRMTAERGEEQDGNSLTPLMMAGSDIALLLDRDGIVRQMAVDDADLAREIGAAWLGQPLLDTVTPESQSKVRAMLASRDGAVVRQEINHPLGDGDLPVRYAAVRLAPDGFLAVLGRDLRDIARLQQQLVDASLSAERDYALQRATEIQFRILFQNTADAIVIADVATRRIGSANPAAEDLLGRPSHRLLGTDMAALFPTEARLVEDAFVTARALGQVAVPRLAPVGDAGGLAFAGWLIRSVASPQLLIRLSSAEGAQLPPSRARDAWTALRHVPEAIVVADAALSIVAANEGFLDIVGAPTEAALLGEPLGRFLGRHGIDLATLTARAAESGPVRNFETAVRGIHGVSSDMDASAAAFIERGARFFCVLLRPHQDTMPAGDGNPLLRAADEMIGLVGRKSLRDIVRESADVIEELCIEAALELTNDNRASAADLLGLSRQSLYAKLRRYGLGDLPSEGTD